jgi:3-hydroxymyristoyl/3-hydroxydecanoyl-(acyl carrier protein) dehydratase
VSADNGHTGSDAASGQSSGPLDIGRVMAALPHRYPMLLVDRVVDLVPDTSITAIKAVSMNEQFFQGHFPGRPIMPGVLIVEAMAQAAGILAVESLGSASPWNPASSCSSMYRLFRSAPASASSPVVRSSTGNSSPKPISRR